MRLILQVNGFLVVKWNQTHLKVSLHLCAFSHYVVHFPGVKQNQAMII